MTADRKRVPKYARVAAAVKGQITDGTLRPGQPAPSGAALSRLTGYSTLTCRRALRILIADGVLLPGPSRNARPRVAGLSPQAGERDLAAAARALSTGLAKRRRAHGLTQPELALLMEVSVTTVGHAETGRLWQSRDFWVNADDVLCADGDLLRLHEAFGEASAASGVDLPGKPRGSHTAAAAERAAVPGVPEALTAHQSAVLTGEYGPSPAAGRPAEPAAGGGTGSGCGAGPYAGAAPTGPCCCRTAGGHDAVPAGTVPAGPDPACVMIMWANGAVTTVHPPEPEFTSCVVTAVHPPEVELPESAAPEASG
jgi:hypothetical protein